jgi:hypothetical protein
MYIRYGVKESQIIAKRERVEESEQADSAREVNPNMAI